ncbi:hypothetical protein FA09DRAFT_307270 [Tilletiopsis washingtonensis]|uniref:GRIP domain-containing protein n=1 Tax=Tilletiopsis washingtonensis TaxID=58919 RepID=A0A316ZD36_9BASI|nr:hypothetical protein FA09DRAFT_307270 [Tilletiopsis washingtonensis]PWN98934.1 hypothetical protein FA09DRAFT_307270 [Tilletiopsis washingtonensis]
MSGPLSPIEASTPPSSMLAAADAEMSGGAAAADGSSADVAAELERVKEQRDWFESQYQNLLAKLTTMRNTLGERLRNDAEELDRRETQIETLQAQLAEHATTSSTLQSELVASHADVERLQTSLDALRAAPAAPDRTRELSESLERLRIESESFKTSYEEERVLREEEERRREEEARRREEAEERERHWREKFAREEDVARELGEVLEEFQNAQETELQRALGDYQEKYDQVASALEEHKERCQVAEATLSDYKEGAERCKALEKEVKEKNLLVGKLRHEAVILNEHLTEALRRLRTDTSDTNVDRRLVTNLLLQFLTTPRADAKRFEMLSLIASVLDFTEEQRETAGLQRGGNATSSWRGKGRAGAQQGAQSPQAVGDESFSNLFVEFLLSEAQQKPPPSPEATAPSSPQSAAPRSSFNLGSLASLRRASSDLLRNGTGSSNGTSPGNGPLSPPLGKGKGR